MTNQLLTQFINMHTIKFTAGILLTFLSVFTANAQTLEKKIPANASIVATVKTGQLIQLLSADEFSQTASGKKFLEMLSNNTGKELKHINELGVNLTANSYYFRYDNDSISYNCLLIPITDAVKFAGLINSKSGVVTNNNIRTSNTDDSTTFLMWNNQYAIAVSGSLKDYYFSTKEVSERYGLTYMPPYVYSATDSAVDVSLVKVDTTYVISDTTAVEVAPPAVDTSVTVTDEPFVENYYDKDYQIKKALNANWTNLFVKDLFAKDPETSITTSQDYLNSVDEKAVATIWAKNPMGLYYSSLPYSMYGGTMSKLYSSALMNNYGYESISARLFMEDSKIRMTTDFELQPDYAELYSKIYKRKLNKKFLNYINTDSLLGLMTWSVDTKAYLDEFPKMLEKAYGNMGMGVTGDEISVGAEFISLLLDEEAISKVIKGDAMVLFNGVYQYETTYTDYDYDENFNAKEIQKTKKESIPSFMMMFSSDESAFTKKLISYGIKKEAIKINGTFYEMSVPKSPFPIYFMQKDGIFFFTNSLTDMKNIAGNTYQANISKEQKKALLVSNFSVFTSPQKTSAALSSSGMDLTDDLTDMINTFKKMGNINIKSFPIKDNHMQAEMTMDVPEGNSNALKYFFNVIDTFIK